MRVVLRSPLPGADLLEAVAVAVDREGHLFAAGELVVLRALPRLSPDALELYARLTLRAGAVFAVRRLGYELDVHAAVVELEAASLVHRDVPDDRCLDAFVAADLRAACVRLGLPRGGGLGELRARLLGRRWVGEPVVLVRHRELVTRVERLSGVDRSLLVAERKAHVRWASYALTPGPGLFADRAALRTWERARRGEWADADEPRRIAFAGPPRWGLSPWRYAVDAVLAAGADADTLARIPGQRPRLALQLEKEGRAAEALAVCATPDPDPALDVALARTGRRLARVLGRSFSPRPPLHEPPVRTLRLAAAGRVGARPGWGRGVVVEQAVIDALAAVGREAVHAENHLWTSLYALVFRTLYWLPRPGRLPSARRGGPLDLGTRAFYEDRRAEGDAALARLRAEGAAPFLAAWSGEVLDGLSAPDLALAVGARLEGAFIAAILERLLREGWAVARGLPDLLVLDGPRVRLDGGVPAELGAGAMLAEVKGPTDTLRDDQRVWNDHLAHAGIHLEIWHVA